MAGGEHVAPFEPGEELTEQPERKGAMVYLLDTSKYEWDKVPYVSHELVQKQIQGLPLQQSDIPAEPQLAGSFDLPDICRPTGGFLFVSDRGRAALEELAPGCAAFFPLNLKAPESIHAAKAYYFIDVRSRAQCIDWDRSETLRRIERAADGRESRALGRLFFKPSTKFKAVTPDMPKMWREADVDRPTVHFFHSKENVFMRDELWEALNVRFPGQLVPRKLAES